MKFNEYTKLESLSDNDLLLVQEANTLAVRSVKLSKLKQYIGVTGGSTGSIKDEILRDSPVGYWQFDETTGNVANNLGSGMSNGIYSNVTLGQPSLTNGSLYSAQFTNQDSYVCFTNTILTNNTNVTIELVIKLLSASINGLFINLGSGYEIGLGIGGGGDTNSPGNYLIGIAGNVVWRPTYKNIGIGTHHLTMIYQGASSREWLFYIDGFLVSTLSSVTPNTPNNVGSIGKFGNGQLTLDEVAIYNKSLSPNRILNHANIVIY